MISDREWIARLSNLLHNNRDISNQLKNVYTRYAAKLTKEEADILSNCSKNITEPNPQFLQVYNGLKQQILKIRPHDRGFKLRLDSLEKDITAIRVQNAADLERINGRIKKLNDAIISREKRSSDIQTPAISGNSNRDTIPVFDSPIQEFQEYISKNGGFTGGWDSESHANFIRVYNRFHGEDLSKYLDNIPAEAVDAHTIWYKKFLALRERMKIALNQQREENRKIEDSAPSSPRVDPEIVKKRIQDRKQQKEKQVQKQVEIQKQQKEAEEAARKERYEQLKKEYLSKPPRSPPKKIVEVQIDPAAQRAKSQAIKKEDWERFKNRDKEILEKKAAATKKQQEAWIAHQENERRLAEENAKNYRNIKRDPERLMKPTAAVLARKNAEDNDQKGPVNSIFEIPHRATPAWLQ